MEYGLLEWKDEIQIGDYLYNDLKENWIFLDTPSPLVGQICGNRIVKRKIQCEDCGAEIDVENWRDRTTIIKWETKNGTR